MWFFKKKKAVQDVQAIPTDNTEDVIKSLRENPDVWEQDRSYKGIVNHKITRFWVGSWDSGGFAVSGFVINRENHKRVLEAVRQWRINNVKKLLSTN